MENKKTRPAWGVGIGDWWLMVLFGLLMIQSVYGLFVPLADDSAVQSIDIVFRTSIAAIFGYIISTNFGRRSDSTTPTEREVDTPIGFATQTPQENDQFNSMGGKREETMEEVPPPPKVKRIHRDIKTQQLTFVGIIGVVSLVIMLFWRNTYNPSEALNTGNVAVISQLRDMVSGCVGFLIGHPQDKMPDPQKDT